MRIHTDKLDRFDILAAANIARAAVVVMTEHGSRSRARAFNVKLEGESRRRPNGGSSGAGSEYAATWDQWGVFLAVLFERDPDMLTPYYKDAADFDYRTACRFEPRGSWRMGGASSGVDYWPEDAHGDHTFRFEGVAGQQSCTKCSAVQRWGF